MKRSRNENGRVASPEGVPIHRKWKICPGYRLVRDQQELSVDKVHDELINHMVVGVQDDQLVIGDILKQKPFDFL